jgi:hypothetical protein
METIIQMPSTGFLLLGQAGEEAEAELLCQAETAVTADSQQAAAAVVAQLKPEPVLAQAEMVAQVSQ